MSDHKILYLHRAVKSITRSNIYTKTRQWSKLDKNQFILDVQFHPSHLDALHQKDPTEIAASFTKMISEPLDGQIPLRRIQIRNNAWKTDQLSKPTRLLLHELNYRKRMLTAFPSQEAKSNIRKLQKKVKTATDQDRRQSIVDSIEQGRVKGIWQQVNYLTGRKSRSVTQVLIKDGIAVLKPIEISQAFQDTFREKLEKINHTATQKRLNWGAGATCYYNNSQDNRASGTDGGHPENINPSADDLKDQEYQDKQEQQQASTFKLDPTLLFAKTVTKPEQKFSFKKVSIAHMTKLLQSMKSTKTTGPDGISMHILKTLKMFAIPIITRLFNQMIEEESYPRNQKTSRVLPTLKPGEHPTDPTGFRAINLLNALSKILDKELYTQI